MAGTEAERRAIEAALRDLKGPIEAAMTQALVRVFDERQVGRRRWSDYELSRSLEELHELSRRRDACYDRPSIGWAYACWYQAKRMHDATRLLLPDILSSGVSISLIDLGCGTGATLWGLAAIRAAAKAAGVALPSMEAVATDASAPMLKAAEQLWGALGADEVLGPSVREVPVRWSLRSWTDLHGLSIPRGDRILAIAGHLFDASDLDNPQEVAADLRRALSDARVDVFLTSTTAAKVRLADDAAALLGEAGWKYETPRSPTYWKGPISVLGRARRKCYAAALVTDERLDQDPRWHGRIHERRFARTKPETELFPPDQGLPFRLDERQREAAIPSARLTAVIGAAGSGKSWVLIERVVRTAEGSIRQATPVNILVTAFNKRMVAQLNSWLGRRLAASELQGLEMTQLGECEFKWSSPTHDLRPMPRVRLLNIDKLMYEIGGLSVDSERYWCQQISGRITNLGLLDGATPGQLAVLNNPAFLLEETRNVIYGRRHLTLDGYRAGRRGRRKPLLSETTDLVWRAVMPQDGERIPPPKTYAHQRFAGLAALEASHDRNDPAPYTHVFVDECQDLTESDFHALTYLAPDPNHIFVAGDETQATRLGSTYRRPGTLEIPPRYRTGTEQARTWRKIRLPGSYRLPMRLCEAVQPLAAQLQRDRGIDALPDSDVELPRTSKSAVLGLRPIIIKAEAISTELPKIWEEYHEHLAEAQADDQVVTTIETDPRSIPRPEGWRPDQSKMLNIKGIERFAVVWPTAASIPVDEVLENWIYTILTRSRALLVIAVDPARTSQRVAATLSLLREDRLLFWDRPAAAAWQEMLALSPGG